MTWTRPTPAMTSLLSVRRYSSHKTVALITARPSVLSERAPISRAIGLTSSGIGGRA